MPLLAPLLWIPVVSFPSLHSPFSIVIEFLSLEAVLGGRRNTVVSVILMPTLFFNASLLDPMGSAHTNVGSHTQGSPFLNVGHLGNPMNRTPFSRLLIRLSHTRAEANRALTDLL